MDCLESPRADFSPPTPPSVSAPFGIEGNIDEAIGMITADVYVKMKAKGDGDIIYSPEARHLKYRRILVDWMCEVGAKRGLNKSTMHVAVRYLDTLLQQIAVEKNRLQLFAICCLIIAAKYEEAEENVPSPAQLKHYAVNTYSTDLIQQMELLVLDKLNWTVSVVTPLHLLGYYLEKGVLYEADTLRGDALIVKLPKYIRKYSDFFADLSLQEYKFQQYPASIMACAIVLASRKALGVQPVWRAELTELTGNSYESFHKCAENLYRHYSVNFPSSVAAESDRASPKSVMEMM